MYSLKKSSDVPGTKRFCMVGQPNNMVSDLCICTELSSNIYIPINSMVLRKALLANPTLTREVLGLDVAIAGKPVLKPIEEPIEELIEETIKPKTTKPKGKKAEKAKDEEEQEW